MSRSRRRGVVDSYDTAAGYGAIRDGGDCWWFHCTAIADGTREIGDGAAVTFAVTAGRRGRWEATAVEQAS